MKFLLHLWVKSTEGVTAIEYGLLAAGISLAAMAAMFVAGDSLETLFNASGTAIDQSAARIDTTL